MKPRIAFFGTPEFSARLLEAIIASDQVTVAAVLCQPDRPQGRSQRVLPPPVKSVAQRNGIPCLQPTSVRKELASVQEFLAAHGPLDLTIVVAFGQILPIEILNLPRHGSCNVHASLLPRWRGAAPIQRAIQYGDKETGICLMQMDAGLDTGAVYTREAIFLTEQESFATLHDRLCDLSISMLQRDLPSIAEGRITALSQSDEGVSYAHKIKSEEALVDWTRPAVEIERTLRAFDPAPGAFTFLEGKRLKIFRGLLLGKTNGKPGEILSADRSGIMVSCGDAQGLLLQELQLEGRRRQNSHEFINGLSVNPGTILGNL